VIGWAAATGDVSLVPLILFAIIFMWTPPHFWALSLWAHADYARAKVPMLPVTAGARETRRQVLIYTLAARAADARALAVGFSGRLAGRGRARAASSFMASWRLREPQDEGGAAWQDARRSGFPLLALLPLRAFGALAIDGCARMSPRSRPPSSGGAARQLGDPRR
jgi:protoheme IX farnesyltransferase